MDYHTQLKRFLNHRVCVDLWGRNTLWGTLAMVACDHIRLTNTVIVGELEGHGWFEQMQYRQDGETGGPRYSETIVRIEAVLHISCVDDDLADSASLVMDGNNKTESEILSGNLIRATPSDLSIKLAEHQSSIINNSTEHLDPDGTVVIPNDRLEVELGVGLLPLAIPSRGGDFLDRVAGIRKQIALEKGVIMPRTRIRDCLQLDTFAYRIRVNRHIVARGELLLDRLLATNLNATSSQVEGTDAIEPLCRGQAKWIEHKYREMVEMQGSTVIEPECILATHLAKCVRDSLHKLFGYQDVLRLLDNLRIEQAETIAELVPAQVTVVVLHRLLISLLEEKVSIRCLMRIVESVAYHGAKSTNLSKLLRWVRADIGHEICMPFTDDAGRMRVRMLNETIETTIADTFVNKKQLSVQKSFLDLVDSLPADTREYALVVRRAEIRRPLFEAIARHGKFIAVISENEVPLGIVLHPV